MWRFLVVFGLVMHVSAIAAAEPKALEFAGNVWTYAGPTDPQGFVYMDAREYKSNEPGVRLLELTRPGKAEFGKLQRQLSFQRLIDGRWLDDGPVELWGTDGTRTEATYRHNVLNGVSRVYRAGGELHVERIYSNDSRRVHAKGYWPNGKLQYESLTVDGKEIRGRSWNEKGEPTP